MPVYNVAASGILSTLRAHPTLSAYPQSHKERRTSKLLIQDVLGAMRHKPLSRLKSRKVERQEKRDGAQAEFRAHKKKV